MNIYPFVVSVFTMANCYNICITVWYFLKDEVTFNLKCLTIGIEFLKDEVQFPQYVVYAWLSYPEGKHYRPKRKSTETTKMAHNILHGSSS